MAYVVDRVFRARSVSTIPVKAGPVMIMII